MFGDKEGGGGCKTYFSPVDFEICEGGFFKEGKHCQDMRIIMEILEIFSVMCQITSLVPSSCYSGIILPVVEEVEVFRVRVVECYHGEMFVEVGDVSAVEYASRCGLSWADRV